MPRTISSVKDLIKELKSSKKADRGPMWCRGHANSTWELLPSYNRLQNPPKETDLVNKFRQNANMLVDRAPSTPYDFGWMFLMQHYGLPTRLLDWTESPLVALYFAINDKNQKLIKKDGSLWCLFPQELNQHANKETYIPSFEDSWLATYSVEQCSKEKDMGILPIAAIATRNNPRIQAQAGVFTISHLKKAPINKIADGKHCIEFLIPHDAKISLNNELKLLGFNKFQVFPELSSISDVMREEFK